MWGHYSTIKRDTPPVRRFQFQSLKTLVKPDILFIMASIMPLIPRLFFFLYVEPCLWCVLIPFTVSQNWPNSASSVERFSLFSTLFPLHRCSLLNSRDVELHLLNPHHSKRCLDCNLQRWCSWFPWSQSVSWSSPKILKSCMHTSLPVPSRISALGKLRVCSGLGGSESVEDVGGSALGIIACSGLRVFV